ncbi:hypothetical protein PF003_g30980 [Phytophthora fragariae]|nr:hypothetical protein PF003_g30980 [Phytophthora fragariae]
MFVAFATPKALTEPTDVAATAPDVGVSMTTLRRCWPRWSWRSPRRRLSLSPPTWRRLRRRGSSMTTLRRLLASMFVAFATPKALTEPHRPWRRLRRCGSSMDDFEAGAGLDGRGARHAEDSH